MKTTEYILEVYKPQSPDDVWITFSSSSPFMTIGVGDIVNPGLWPDSQSPMKVLRAINVDHVIWETETRVKHKVLVFTEEVDGTRGLRLSKG